MRSLSRLPGLLALLFPLSCSSAAPPEFSTVTEKHIMIPMRDGKHLSAYVYFPPGNGPWPAIF